MYLEHLLIDFLWKEWFGIENEYISLNKYRVMAHDLH